MLSGTGLRIERCLTPPLDPPSCAPSGRLTWAMPPGSLRPWRRLRPRWGLNVRYHDPRIGVRTAQQKWYARVGARTRRKPDKYREEFCVVFSSAVVAPAASKCDIRRSCRSVDDRYIQPVDSLCTQNNVSRLHYTMGIYDRDLIEYPNRRAEAYLPTMRARRCWTLSHRIQQPHDRLMDPIACSARRR